MFTNSPLCSSCLRQLLFSRKGPTETQVDFLTKCIIFKLKKMLGDNYDINAAIRKAGRTGTNY